MHFVGYIVAETSKSVLLAEHFWSKPDWLPRSQIEILRDVDTTEVQVLASDWICQQKKLQEFSYREVT